MRDIRRGAELTFDYRLGPVDPAKRPRYDKADYLLQVRRAQLSRDAQRAPTVTPARVSLPRSGNRRYAIRPAPSRAASGASLRTVSWNTVEFPGEVTRLGVEPAGHVVQQHARGEKFYLDPSTGDMVFVK